LQQTNNKAFTLIEMVISITIMSLMVLLLYSGLDSVNKSSLLLSKKNKIEESKFSIKKLLFLDFIQAQDINITKQNKQFDIIKIKTKNSLYGISSPNVGYIVLNNNLIRIEGIDYAMPIKDDFIYQVKADIILKDIQSFKLYRNKTQDKLLVSLKQKKQDMLIFEILTASN